MEKVKENLKGKKEEFYHYIQLDKELSSETLDEIISNIVIGADYDPITGTLNMFYTMPERAIKEEPRRVWISFFIGKGLSDEERNKIIINDKFRYNPNNGLFAIIHTIIHLL